MGKGNRNRATPVKAKKEAEKSSIYSKLIKIGALALAALFLVILVFGVLHTSGLLQKSVTAVRVGDVKISALDFNIFYNDVMNDFLNQYGYTLQMYGVDLTAGFESQIALFGDGEQTWRDYFREQAVASAKQVVMLCEEGKAAGHEMDEKFSKLFSDSLTTLEATAAYYGMTTEGFLSSAYSYGNGTKLADFKRVSEMKYYAASYSQTLHDSYIYSEDDIEAHYLENRKEYDEIDYYTYSFEYETFTYTEPEEGEEVTVGGPQSEDEATRMTDESRAAAKAEADAFLARVVAGEDFDAVAREYFEAEEAGHEHGENDEAHEFTTARNTLAGLTGTGALTDWMIAEGRTEGDKDVVDTGTAMSVFQFISRHRKETPTATVRHILIKYDTPAADATEEEKLAAELQNQEAFDSALALYSEWQSGDATEDAFAELAKEHSADSNASEGGIFEHFSKGSMVEPFDQWCFDESRKYGDVDIVVTEFGAHLIFFVGFDKPAYYYSIESKLKNTAYDEYIASIEVNYPVSSSSLAMSVCF